MGEQLLEVQKNNECVCNDMDEGDLIEFKRGMYSHWAVCSGEGMVIHLSGDNDGIGDGLGNPNKLFTISGVHFDKAHVKEDKFMNVAGDSMATINNSKDRKCRPSTAAEIIERARSKMGEIGYNVLWKNCEHFAAWCRYGVEWSEQVDNFLTWFSIGTTIAGTIGLLFGMSRHRTKQKK